MAEEKEGNIWEMPLILIGILTVLILLWFVGDGPERADLKSLFLSSPEIPTVPQSGQPSY